jgi:thymidylate kinase
VGWVRLGRNLLKFWTAYLVKIRPAVRSGALVVGDRWAYGYVGQPHGLRFYGPDWLAAFTIRLFPAPDAVLSLSAPPALIHQRKQELDEAEISAEMTRWSGLRGVRLLDIDATQSPDVIASSVLERIKR